MTALWLPGRLFLDSAEAFALDDLNPPPPQPADPWAATIPEGLTL